MNGMSNVLNTCGCCEGVEQLTPATILNRPGLNALAYRVGIQATFLETMLARLSNIGIPLGELDTVLNDPDKAAQLIFPLLPLTTRSTDDPAIALDGLIHALALDGERSGIIVSHAVNQQDGMFDLVGKHEG